MAPFSGLHLFDGKHLIDIFAASKRRIDDAQKRFADQDNPLPRQGSLKP
jgi:hypothetical protein